MKAIHVIAIAAVVIVVGAIVGMYVLEERPGADVVYEDSRDRFSTVSGDGDVAEDCMFTQAGYVFVGWNTEKDGSGTTYMPGDSIDVSGGKVRLYAMWAPSVMEYLIGAGSDTTALGESVVIVRPDGTEAGMEEGIVLDLPTTTIAVRGDAWEWSMVSDGSDGTAAEFLGTNADGDEFHLEVVIASATGDVRASLIDGDPTYAVDIDGPIVVILFAQAEPLHAA